MTVKKNSTSSISSPGSADSVSDLNQPDLFGPSPSVNENPSAKPSSESIGPTFQSLTTCEPSQQMDLEELTSSSVASHASPGPTPGSSEAQKMTVTSGRKWLPLLKSYNLDGSLAKMCEALLVNRWASSAAFLTWRASDTAPSHLLLELAVSMPRTAATAFGLLHTPTATANQMAPSMRDRDPGSWWPTPDTRGFTNEGSMKTLAKKAQTKAEFNGMAYRAGNKEKFWPTPTTPSGGGERSGGRAGTGNLHFMERSGQLWPTPVARDRKGLSGAGRQKRKGHPKDTLPNAAGGSLNPEWVEWLMGFPLGWTNLTAEELQAVSKTERHGLRPSVTRSSQVSSRKSGEQYLKRSVRE
jgi:hypothetical protein